MTILINKEIKEEFAFDYEKTINDVILAALDYVNCPYECMVEIDIVHNDEIQGINKEFREIDNPTDVLSFPLVDYEIPGDFAVLDELDESMYFEPETGELLLGNIILSYDKILSQAKEYGHDERRELAFLVAHSMFHLFGYDHMEDEERKQMEKMQEEVLTGLGITR